MLRYRSNSTVVIVSIRLDFPKNVTNRLRSAWYVFSDFFVNSPLAT
jgi:hypothetical protein